MTSSRMRSGISDLAFSSASAPSTAVMTSYPPDARIAEIISRMVGLSSTANILALAMNELPFPHEGRT